MIHRLPRLVLPLMHHLMQQRVQCFAPAVSSQMSPADRDLGRPVLAGRAVARAKPAQGGQEEVGGGQDPGDDHF